MQSTQRGRETHIYDCLRPFERQEIWQRLSRPRSSGGKRCLTAAECPVALAGRLQRSEQGRPPHGANDHCSDYPDAPSVLVNRITFGALQPNV